MGTMHFCDWCHAVGEDINLFTNRNRTESAGRTDYICNNCWTIIKDALHQCKESTIKALKQGRPEAPND